jgi:hypothetical protein
MGPDITDLLDDWPYDNEQSMRIIAAKDGRMVLQVRLPLGIEQYELDGRPDGARPAGKDTVIQEIQDRLTEHVAETGGSSGFELTEEECQMVQEEAVLFYHRYLLLFQVNDFERVERDTEHNLQICHLLESFCSDEEERNAVLQFRPYILRMNAMARSMQRLGRQEAAQARQILESTIVQIRDLDEIDTPAFQFERVRSINYLKSALEQVKEKQVDPVDALKLRLSEAVEAEDYELAAQIRDQIRNHNP